MTTRPTPRNENFDMDSFFDFTQSTTQASPLTSTDSRMDTMSSYHPAEEARQFSGPSHDYNHYKQQVGLPMGSVINMPPQNMFGGYGSGIDDLTFDGMSGWSSGIDIDADVNLDFANPTSTMPNMFLPTTIMENTSMDNFINPYQTIGQSDMNTSNVGRLWPGMHSQQAHQLAMQKAAQTQAIQRQMKMQAQHAQYRQASVSQPASLPASSAPTNSGNNNHHNNNGGSNASKRPSHITEPHVEESISRLLSQMRQKSAVSDDADSPDDGASHMAHLKKGDEEMDEDERLLASEEGKKLSSKERRQLRNKVSARAFRSRRKEYISQLEGEVAMKAQEAHSLRNENQALMQENERYRGLIETLLRHPAFTPFINDISKDPSVTGAAAQIQSQLQATQPAQVQPPTQRQPAMQMTKNQSSAMQQKPSQQSQPQSQADVKHDFLNFDIPNGGQHEQQIGVAMLPENDFSKLNLHGLRRSLDFSSLQAVNAYAITGLSCGPDPIGLLAEDASVLHDDSNLSILLAKLDGAARRLDTNNQV